MEELTLQFINFWILTPISLLFRGVLILFIFTIFRRLLVRRSKTDKVTVVVLGDIGRSPRMQYHSLSLAKNGYFVKFVGFSGSTPHPAILDSVKICLHFTPEVVSLKGVPKIVSYGLKILIQSFFLLWTLFAKVGATEFMLLQNPPCIPGLAICWLVSVWNGSKLIIDWHNYGYSMLALGLGKSHIIVKVAKWYEEMFGQLSSGNLCVTKAMENDLMQRWNISAEVMHDRPASIFKTLNNEEKHELFSKLSSDYAQFKSLEYSNNCTRFTKMLNGEALMRNNRPAFVVSSTSWTEDEDFSVLLQALQDYDLQAESGSVELPDILCAITGKGPLKGYYQEKISQIAWKHVSVITPWLESEDYPKLLACADLGVSLHTSSSGLDLPMKVVDMFGCGLPVAAINFACLNELVQHGSNGFVFNNAMELSKHMQSAFNMFPHDQTLLLKLRKKVESFQQTSWDESWDKIVLPMFKR